ncbi:hypothetical protein AAMO2058_001269200 [Amorphochlora amoebiformis]
MRKRWVIAVFGALWILWFVISAAIGGKDVIIEIVGRGKRAWGSTAELFRAMGTALFHWIDFTAPFVIDVWNILSEINNWLSLRTRVATVLGFFALTGMYLSIRRVMSQKDNVIRIAFQSSVILTAPLMWLGLGLVPTPSLWEPYVLPIVHSVIPCILSLRAFWDSDRRLCGRWLRYWTVFPVVQTAADLVTNYKDHSSGAPVTFQPTSSPTGTFFVSSMGGKSSLAVGIQTPIPGEDTIYRILIVFTLWLEIYDSSLAFHWFCSRLGRACVRTLHMATPNGFLRGITDPFGLRETCSDQAKLGRRILFCVTENAVLATLLTLIIGTTFFLFFHFLTTLIPALLMWGASMSSVEVVVCHIEQLYEQKIAFWILMQASSLTLFSLPILGTFLLWLRIPALICFYMFGSQILTFICSSLGRNSKSHPTSVYNSI